MRAPAFEGLKLAHAEKSCARDPRLQRIEIATRRDRLLVETPGRVGDGGNSGFQALNLALQFGARRIVLVGFDLRLDGGVHWHGRHPPGLNNPQQKNLMRWRRAIDGAARDFAALGVEVLNASPVSTLAAYPLVSLQEALEC